MRVWVISDTHWNHKNIVEYENRDPNYNQILIDNWNKVVKPDDLVIHLGDVIFSQSGQLSDILGQLKGTKILTLGNHDQKKPQWYMNKGFAVACEYFVFRNILFSHKPRPVPDDLKYCVHGHFHDNDHRSKEFQNYDWYTKNLDQYYLVNIESDLAPQRLDDIVKTFESRTTV